MFSKGQQKYTSAKSCCKYQARESDNFLFHSNIYFSFDQVGDGTNLVIILAGALLKEAEELLRMGLKPTEVADGYELALEKALEILETLSCHEVKDISDKEAVKKVIRTSVMSKQYGNEDFLANLVSEKSA